MLRSPGVYVQEQAELHPISPVAAETTAFVGLSDYGPPAEAVQVSSWEEFQATFMFPKSGKRGLSIPRDNPLSHSVRGYFSNGGTKAVIVRLSDASLSRTAHRTRSIRGDTPVKQYAPVEPGEKILIRELYASALESLDDVKRISLLVTPDLQDPDVVESVVDYTRSRREFVYLIDSPAEASARDVAELPARYSSDFGAMYYPWLLVSATSPKQGKPVSVRVPSTGHIAGVICRLDRTRPRGVFAAPAGTIATIEGALGTSSEVTPGLMSDLGPRNVNCLRRLATGATAIWGIRTTSGQYMNIRRGMTFVERSLKEGLEWAIFETPSPSVWAQVSTLTDNFLLGLYRDGILLGAKPSETYFVRCNAETNTSSDIAQGRLNLLVGLALMKPAEFQVLRISLQCAPPSP